MSSSINQSSNFVIRPTPIYPHKENAPCTLERIVSELGNNRFHTHTSDNNPGVFAPLNTRNWGSIAFPDGSTYTGDVFERLMHGKGCFISKQGYRYVGDFFNGVFNGQGSLWTADGSEYFGQFQKGKLHGKGFFINGRDGSRYKGEYTNGVIQGKGILKKLNGKTIIGDFHAGVPHGKVRVFYPCGLSFEGICDKGLDFYGIVKRSDNQVIYKGQIRNEEYHGKGMLFLNNGNKYNGYFYQGKFHGRGKYSWGNGKSAYIGQFEMGERTGFGTLIISENVKYMGNFYCGSLHGYGKVVYANGAEFQARFEHGNLAAPGRLVLSNGCVLDGMDSFEELHEYV